MLRSKNKGDAKNVRIISTHGPSNYLVEQCDHQQNFQLELHLLYYFDFNCNSHNIGRKLKKPLH